MTFRWSWKPFPRRASMANENHVPPGQTPARGFLGWVEWAGNKLPDPAMLFVWALLISWLASALLAPVSFADDIDPRTGKALEVKSQLTGRSMTLFMTRMVETFVGF